MCSDFPRVLQTPSRAYPGGVEFLFAADQQRTTTQETTQEAAREKILVLLKMTRSMTRKQLSKRKDISEEGIKYHLSNLRTAGLIRQVGPTKAGQWEVLK
jgi:predicted HTH transcriptional regulator